MDNFYIFKNRKRAGKILADKLEQYIKQDVVVCAIPRGGVVIGSEVAKHLNAPLDIIVTKKIGHPQNSEYAICTVDEDQNFTGNPNMIRTVSPSWLQTQIEKGRDEVRRKKLIYRGPHPSENLKDKTVILVDDGVATGLTLEHAIKMIKSHKPRKLILAVPMAPTETLHKFSEHVDEIVSLLSVKSFLGSVGAYYIDFPEVSDGEVIDLMRKSRDNVVTKFISYRI